MKIVMFTDAYWPRVNGVTVSVDTYSRSLSKAGHEVLIVCSSYPESFNRPLSSFDIPSEEGGPQIVRVPSLPALITKEDRLAKFNKYFWVFRQVKLFDPDIVHINTEMMIAEFGFWYARATNLPAIYTFHTMWEEYGPNYFPMFPSFLVKFFIRGILKYILYRSYRVIVPTPQIDEVVKVYRKHSHTYLLPTGIDPELFDHDKAEGAAYREGLEEQYPALKGKKILLFAGRVTKEKNISFLIGLLPKILEAQRDTVLFIVGSGPDLDLFKAEAHKLGLEGSCIFTGYMDRKDLALIYSISEIFVFPSLTDTQGLVTLEAMFSGVPVVAIGALGTLMVMGGDNGGFMVKNDAGDFTRRVLELLSDSTLHHAKSLEAREHARSWSIDELTKKLIQIYDSTIGEYKEEHGEKRTPVWNLLMNKRWWKINNRIFKDRANQKLQEMLVRFSKQGSE
ncbi:MAG: glycosyltransferase [Treponema sp.]|nr:glycosyltransferase [Treponema sp.]